MKHFTSHEVDEAKAYAARGGQALHTHQFIGDYNAAPSCFVREVKSGRDIAHICSTSTRATDRHGQATRRRRHLRGQEEARRGSTSTSAPAAPQGPRRCKKVLQAAPSLFPRIDPMMPPITTMDLWVAVLVDRRYVGQPHKYIGRTKYDDKDGSMRLCVSPCSRQPGEPATVRNTKRSRGSFRRRITSVQVQVGELSPTSRNS